MRQEILCCCPRNAVASYLHEKCESKKSHAAITRQGQHRTWHLLHHCKNSLNCVLLICYTTVAHPLTRTNLHVDEIPAGILIKVTWLVDKENAYRSTSRYLEQIERKFRLPFSLRCSKNPTIFTIMQCTHNAAPSAQFRSRFQAD